MTDEEEDIEKEPVIDPTELVMVPNYVHGCNICKWSKTNVDLYNWAAQKALQGVPPTTIQKLLVEYMPINHPDVKVPSGKSVWNHFKKHVPPKEELEMLAAKVAASRQVMAEKIADMREHVPSDHDPLVSEKALAAVLGGNFDEYTELCALYTKFREVNDKIYKTAGSLLCLQPSGFNDWSQNKINTYVSMVNTQKSILAEIGKMRQGDKLVSVVAKYIIEMFTKSIVGKLSEEFETLAGIMRRQGVPNDVMEAFQAVTHDRLAHLIVEEAKTAMVQTKKEFKLPN